MSDPIAKGDQIARMTKEVQDALELGGISTGFTFTAPDRGEFDAYASDGTKLEIRVELGR